jgi:hypothetical protein
MPRKSNPELHELWRDRVARQLASGLSVAQFCAQEECAKSAFYRWKFELSLTTPRKGRSLATRSSFLPVAVRLVDSNAAQPVPIEADLPNGIRLRIPTGNAGLACRLVRTIAGARTDSGGSR